MEPVTFSGFSFVEGGVSAAKGFKVSGADRFGLILSDRPLTAACYPYREIPPLQALLAGNFSDEKKVAASAVKTLSLSEDALQVVSLSVGDLVSEKEVEESLWKERAGKFLTVVSGDVPAVEAALEFRFGDHKCRIGGCSGEKGFLLTTDAEIPPSLLQIAVDETVRRLLPDETKEVLLLSSGRVEHLPMTIQDERFFAFVNGVYILLLNLIRLGAGEDGLVEYIVTGAERKEEAIALCRALLKAPLAADGKTLLETAARQGLLNDQKVLSLAICSEKGKILLAKNNAFVTPEEDTVQKVWDAKEWKVFLTVKGGVEKALMVVSRKKKMEEQDETPVEIK